MLALVNLFLFSLFEAVPLGSPEPPELVVGVLTCVWGEFLIISNNHNFKFLEFPFLSLLSSPIPRLLGLVF